MINNPKKNQVMSLYNQNDWYPYYASYSDRFVNECISKYTKSYSMNSFSILDPWNGTGTTTLCANKRNIRSVGIDINPVMYIIAKAKMFPVVSVSDNTWEELTDKEEIKSAKISYKDPLCQWFSRSSVRNIRSLERKLNFGCLDDNKVFYCRENIDSVNSRTAYVYLCMFLILRKYSVSLHGSNPTWVKSSTEDKIQITYEDLRKDFLGLIRKHKITPTEVTGTATDIRISTSQALPIENESIDLVITSPPYCTRIDYAIYTQIENAMLGYGSTDIKALRAHMLGSPTVHNSDYRLETITEYCNGLLNSIRNHASKAAATYYYKIYRQYFEEMQVSLMEIQRVLKKGGTAIIVVQDSWFKDIHIDVARAIIEMGESLGLSSSREEYNVKNNMVYINTKSRVYVDEKNEVETVIELKKEAL